MEDYKIHIVAYKGISKISKIIRYLSHSDYSHVEVLRPNPDKPNSLTSTIGSINFKGVMYWNIDKHTPDTEYEIYELQLDKIRYKLFWKFIYDNMGKKYDLLGVLGFILHSVKQEPDKFYCSELIYLALLHAGINFWNHKKRYISPGTLVGISELTLVKTGKV